MSISDRSENNYGGAFTFTNLDEYRDTLLGTGYPTQFSITTGEPLQKVSRTDYGLFITDDWRVNPGVRPSPKNCQTVLGRTPEGDLRSIYARDPGGRAAGVSR